MSLRLRATGTVLAAVEERLEDLVGVMEVTVRSGFDCPASDGAEKKPRNLALRGLKPPFQRVEETRDAWVKRELTLAQSQSPCNRKSDFTSANPRAQTSFPPVCQAIKALRSLYCFFPTIFPTAVKYRVTGHADHMMRSKLNAR